MFLKQFLSQDPPKSILKPDLEMSSSSSFSFMVVFCSVHTFARWAGTLLRWWIMSPFLDLLADFKRFDDFRQTLFNVTLRKDWLSFVRSIWHAIILNFSDRNYLIAVAYSHFQKCNIYFETWCFVTYHNLLHIPKLSLTKYFKYLPTPFNFEYSGSQPG